MKLINLIDSGTLYANPHPADWAIHAYFPRIVEIAADDLLCVYRRASTMYADDGRSHVLRSTDRGCTWRDEGCVYDGASESRVYSYSATNLSVLGDQIILSGLRFTRPRPDMTVYDPETRGSISHESILFRSFDNGRTWSGPQIIQKPAFPHLKAYSPVVGVEDGQWLLAFDRGKLWNDPEPPHPYVVGLISSDQGKTWDKQVEIAGGPEGERTYWHPRIIKLSDGRLLAFLWTGNGDATKFLPLHRVVGEPDGCHWGEPEPVGLQGQTNCPVDLGDGCLAMAVTIRESEHPGIYAALSVDEGRSWSTDSMVQIWDAYGRESLGVPRTDTYPASHDTIAFGAPDAIYSSEGDILASFWASQRGQMVCRWSRLRVKG